MFELLGVIISGVTGPFYSFKQFFLYICAFRCIFREDYRWIKANQKRIIDCISENILDQNDSSRAAMMSAFDLSSEGLESQIEKISFLYDCYGIDYLHTLDEKW